MLKMILSAKRRVIHSEDADASASSEASDKPEAPDVQFESSSSGEVILEPWVEWIRRTTHYVESQMHRCKIDDWVTAYRKRKFNFADRIAHFPEEHWSKQVLSCDPEQTHGLSRRRGRPKTRWEDFEV